MGNGYSMYRLAPGPDEIGDVGLKATTATETPQILLTWNKLSPEHSGVRIVRNRQHTPKNASDGRVVYEANRLDDATSFADTVLIHEETYYYALFLKVDGGWYRPYEGSADYAFSGSKPWLVPKEEQDGDVTVSITGELDREFTPNDTKVYSSSMYAYATEGDWLHIGNGLRPIIARVMGKGTDDVGAHLEVEFNKEEYTLDKSSIPNTLTLQELTIKRNNGAYGGKCTVTRVSGSFLADKYRAGYPVMFTGSSKNKSWKVKRIENVYQTVLTFAADELSSESGRYMCLQTPEWRMPGETVALMRSDGPFLVRRFYEDYLPDNAVEDDEREGQFYDLTETTLESGEKVNLGSPGPQLGLERFMRALLMELAKAHGAANYRIKMRDMHNAPVAYVRRFAGNYAFEIPDGIREDFLARAFATVQPYLATYRGRADNIVNWMRIITGQKPLVRHGKNRVIRFGDTNAGFAWDGVCKVLEVPDSASFTIDEGIWGAVPSYLIGGKVYRVDDFAAGTYTEIGKVAQGTSGGTVYVNTDTSGLTDGDDIIFEPPFPPASGPRAFICGVYDPEITNGVGSFFNDRGVAYYLPVEISQEEADLLRGYMLDVMPVTVSALVFAALEVAVDLR